MQKEEVKILIVDDDQTLGKALVQAFTKHGYKAVHVTKPDDAISTVKMQPVHAAIIDCMLPKMNGRDLAKKLKEELSPDLPILLMSGIYKDRNFVRDAIQSTGAIGFAAKPFDLDEIVGEIESQIKGMLDAPVSPLAALLTKSDISHKERIKAVNDTQEVHGFDLPWIYSLLLNPRVKGHLNIISAEGDVAGVGFENGNIIQVNQDDAKSYFGVLMVEYGFITQQEMDDVIQLSGNSKKLGERLVEANVLSPHAIQIVMAEQQGLRLSRTVNNTSVKVNFVDTEEIRENALTDRVAFTNLLNEWLVSKISLDWLKSFYMPWMRFNMKRGPEYSQHHRCLTIPVVMRVPDLLSTLFDSATLEEAISKLDAPEDHVYRAIHALVLSRVLKFGSQVTSTDRSGEAKRLQKLLESLDGQNYFERLGVSPRAKDTEIKRAYHELAKVLHPDKLPMDTPENIRSLTRDAFERIAVAYTTLNDAKLKANYLLELERGKAEFILQAEQLKDQARVLLSKGDYSKARDLMDAAVKLAPPTPEARLVRMWARLKAPNTAGNKAVLDEVREELSSIPPEDRHNATFYFVKALILRAGGDNENARRNLESALATDAEFIDARRELNTLQRQAKPQVDLMKADLKDVVGMLFKKKK